VTQFPGISVLGAAGRSAVVRMDGRRWCESQSGSGRGRRKRTRSTGTSPAAYFTLWEPEGETPSGYPTDFSAPSPGGHDGLPISLRIICTPDGDADRHAPCNTGNADLYQAARLQCDKPTDQQGPAC